GGPTVALSDSTSPIPNFEAPSHTGDYELTFELRVSDGTNTSVEAFSVAVEDSYHGDGTDETFTVESAVDGQVIEVDGLGGTDSIDLSTFGSDSVAFEEGRLTVGLDGGGSFTVEYSNIESITFADAEALIIDANLENHATTGTTILVDGADVVEVGFEGSGGATLDYDPATDELEIVGLSGTDASTTLSIEQLAGSGLTVSSVTVDADLAGIQSGADIASIAVDPTVQLGTVTVADGSGTIGSLRFDDTGSASVSGGAVVLNADVDSISAHGFQVDVTVNGSTGSISINEDIHGGSTFQVNGDVDSISIGSEVRESATLSISGNIGVLDIGDDIETSGVVTVGGSVTTLSIADDVKSNSLLQVDGDVTDLSIGDDVKDGGRVVIGGSVETFSNSFDVHTGSMVSVEGDVGTLSLRVLDGDLEVSGDLDQLSIGSGDGSLTAHFVEGTISVDGVDVELEAGVSHTVSYDAGSLTHHSNAPTSDAGSDQVVEEGNAVVLSGGGADAGGRDLVYEWVQIGGPSVT
ncbi:MAG: hypothetical protein AAFY46_10215, partial [Planctomycetota bacterium]